MPNHLHNKFASILYICLLPLLLFKNGSNYFLEPNKKHEKLPGKVLAFTMQNQVGLQLCWSAVAASISFYYDKYSTYSQCRIANNCQGKTTCCSDIKPCDIQGFLDKALALTGNLKGNFQTGFPSFATIQNEITNNRPICLRILYRDIKEGHFIVIYGFHDTGEVDVADPGHVKAPGRIAYNKLQLFYQDVGEITHHYLTKPAFE